MNVYDVDLEVLRMSSIDAFTGVLKREGITISMDGRGLAFDNIFVERLWRNVKHEDVYLKGYSTMIELMVGLAEYLWPDVFAWGCKLFSAMFEFGTCGT